MALLLGCAVCTAQDQAVELAMEWLAEQSVAAEEDWNVIEERLRHYLAEPLSIQSTDPEWLSRLPIIPMSTAINIAFYIDRSGKILDWGELTNVRGVDAEWLRITRPFLTLDDPPEPAHPFALSRTQMEFTVGVHREWPLRSGYLKDNYLGSPWMDQGRVNARSGPWQAGLRWQRDAGEPWLKADQGIWDHWSGYIDWESPDRKWSASLGDHRISLGSGLLAFSGFGGRAASDPDLLFRYGRGLRSTASGSEFDHFSGVTVRYRSIQWDIQAGGGYREWDGRYEGNRLLSLSESGLHRTHTEWTRRRNTPVHHFTGLIRRLGRTLRYGINLMYLRLPVPLDGEMAQGGVSTDIQWMSGLHHAKTETALDWVGHWAHTTSWSMRFEPVHLAMRGSVSHPEYNAILGSTPGVYSNPGTRSLETAAGWDHGSSRWRLAVFGGRRWEAFSRKNRPENRYGFRLERTVHAETQWNCRLQIRSDDISTEPESTEIRIYLRNQWDRQAGVFRFRLRNDLHWLKGTPNPSWMLLGETGFHQHSISVDIRYILHVSTDPSTPTWVMDRTTSMRMGVLTLTGSGSTWNMLLRYRPLKQASTAIQLYWNTRLHEPERGSGNDLTLGSNRWGINLELSWKL